MKIKDIFKDERYKRVIQQIEAEQVYDLIALLSDVYYGAQKEIYVGQGVLNEKA